MNEDELIDEDLDERLRGWGSAARRAAPRLDLAAVRAEAIRRSCRSRMLATIGVAAAVVIAVAGAATAVQLNRGGAPPAAHQPDASAPVISSSTASASAGVASAPRAGRQVVFHGLAITVPADWPLNVDGCGTAERDTVVLPNTTAMCGGSASARVTSAEFFDGEIAGLASSLTGVRTEAISIDGVAASRVTGTAGQGVHVVAVTVPSLKAQVVIRSPAASEAARLAGSLTIVQLGPDGCASRDSDLGVLPTGKLPARPGAGQHLIPGTPTSVVVCRYLAGLIEQSATLNAADRETLVSLLNGLPEGLSRANPQTHDPGSCRSPATAAGSVTGIQAGDSEAYLIRAEYRSGPAVTVVVRLGDCGDLGASNGTRTGQLTTDLAKQLYLAVGSVGAHPGDVLPAAGRITGRLLAVGGAPPGAIRPLPGTITLTNTETHQQQSIAVADNGRYSASVAPGTYTIEGHSPQYGDNAYTCRAQDTPSVTANTTTLADVVCQEK